MNGEFVKELIIVLSALISISVLAQVKCEVSSGDNGHEETSDSI